MFFTRIKRGVISARFPGISLDVFSERSRQLVEKYQTQSWFKKTPFERDYHLAVMRFMRKHAARNKYVVESGCGIGQTLVILNAMGFKKLAGVELDTKAYSAAKELLSYYQVQAELYNADAMIVSGLFKPDSVGAYLPLNWTYFVPDMNAVFLCASKILTLNGLLVVDSIDLNYRAKNSKDAATYAKYPFKRTEQEISEMARRNGFVSVAPILRFGSRMIFFYQRVN